MYLSVTTIVLGGVLLTHSRALAVYWVIWFVAVNLFVLGYEEPTLRSQFGVSVPTNTAARSDAGFRRFVPTAETRRREHALDLY